VIHLLIQDTHSQPPFEEMAAKVRNMLPFDPTDEDQLPGPEDLHTMKVLLAEIFCANFHDQTLIIYSVDRFPRFSVPQSR
jgi:hypothetical protein